MRTEFETYISNKAFSILVKGIEERMWQNKENSNGSDAHDKMAGNHLLSMA